MADPSFPTSLRRNPDDPRGLRDRIESQIAERVDEALNLYTLDLLTRLRASRGRSAPGEGNARDRRDRLRLRAEFLRFVDRELRPVVPAIDLSRRSDPARESLAFQVHCAKHLPDYWQRLERIMAAFASSRVEAPRRGLLSRLFSIRTRAHSPRRR